MPDQEMIDRVARAIETELNKLNDPSNAGGFIDNYALTAIKAMREPTEKMIKKAKNYGFNTDSITIYQSMIDSILND